MSTLPTSWPSTPALSGAAVAHLQAVVSEWQLLADLSFSDLLLWVPDRTRPADLRRPGPADHRGDRVRRRPGHRRRRVAGLPAAAARLGGGAGRCPRSRRWTRPRSWIRRQVIPVRYLDEVIAVIERDTSSMVGREGSLLETAYVDAADDLFQMVSDGTFPPHGPSGRDAHRAAGRGRAAPAGRRRQGGLRQPERAVGLPPAGLQRRGDRSATRRADPRR